MIRFNTSTLVILSIVLISAFIASHPVNADQIGDEKCTPCTETPPSPPPPAPCPPPPSPPPPPKKTPSPPSPSSSQNCPPPPVAPFIYITGPPGQQLYPIDQDFNNNSAGSPIVSGRRVWMACVVVGLIGVVLW